MRSGDSLFRAFAARTDESVTDGESQRSRECNVREAHSLSRKASRTSSSSQHVRVHSSSEGREARACAAAPWMSSLAAKATISQFPAGAVLMRPCEQAKSVLLLVAGVAKQTQSDGMLVAVHAAGALLGVEAAICTASHPTTVTALCACAAASIPATALMEWLDADSTGRAAVVGTLARQGYDYMRAVSELSVGPARRRVAWILREIIRKGAERQADGSRRLPFPLPVTEIASMAGAQRETASRALSFWLKRRILLREDGRLRLPPPLAPARHGAPVAR